MRPGEDRGLLCPAFRVSRLRWDTQSSCAGGRPQRQGDEGIDLWTPSCLQSKWPSASWDQPRQRAASQRSSYFWGLGERDEPSDPSPSWGTLVASVHPELLEELTKVLWGLRPIHPQFCPILLPPPPIPSGDPNAPAAVVDTTQPGPDCVPKIQMWKLRPLVHPTVAVFGNGPL